MASSTFYDQISSLGGENWDSQSVQKSLNLWLWMRIFIVEVAAADGNFWGELFQQVLCRETIVGSVVSKNHDIDFSALLLSLSPLRRQGLEH